ncbi:unnamed protein product [Eruca vesicaria subsp. sativa]|uniref:Uncharacterized protein n=1 Tax=Eruca vesicaria subsp. sativa TaxID=29727 RepID=A0ABC8IRY3_ERUVS|nr:unnamed protein product [Eruca vesicaria subsp. sativa]
MQYQPGTGAFGARSSSYILWTDKMYKVELESEDKSMLPSNSGHGVSQSPVDKLNMDTILVPES